MSETQVEIQINGRALKARPGAMIIEVADEAGIAIPRFCYHKKLTIAANCRMCLVEVEKAPKPLPACATPVREGMRVFTDSPVARSAQKAVMEFLLINHPLDCPICDQGGECELQDVAMGFGGDVSRFQEAKRVVKDKDIGPLIATDMTRCIHCTRCVRFGVEIAGMQELGATGRGEYMEIGTFVERQLGSELSGNVIDLCPVGALTSKPFRYRARSWEMVQRPGIAPHDAVGSHLYLHVKGNRVMRVVPRENEAINEVWIADRDRYSYEGLYSPERLLTPMIRQGERWQATDWETALQCAWQGLQEVVATAGAEQIGALGSPSATLEECYLLQKLLRGIGCPHLDHRLRQQDFRDDAQTSLFPSLGLSLVAMETLDAALLVGTFARTEQPLVHHRLRKAVLHNHARMMALNSVAYPFNFDLFAQEIASPPGLVRSLAGIARALLDKSSLPGASQLETLLREAAVTATHRTVAESLAGAGRGAVLLGSTAEIHPEAATLRSLARYIAKQSGATLGTLTSGANSAGAWLAGLVPHREPAGRPARKPGLSARAMLEDGRKAYVLMGIEPELDCGNSDLASQALSRSTFTVSLSAYRTPAMEAYAHVLLPIALFAENTGTFVNGEGVWQEFVAAVRPPGEARPAWKILRVLGNLFALEGFDYMESGDILRELRTLMETAPALVPDDWWIPPRLGESGGGLYHRLADVPIYAVDAQVRRASALQKTAAAIDAAARLCPALAERLGFAEGEPIAVHQNGARKTLPVRIDPQVAEDCVLIHAGVPGSVGLGPGCGPIELLKT